MYYSKITPDGVTQAKPIVTIKPAPVHPDSQEETPKVRSFAFRAFASAARSALKVAFHPYIVLPIAVYAAGVRAYVATEQYDETKYGARNDWSLPASCSVENAANGKVYNFATKDQPSIAKGTNIASSPRHVYLECEKLMNSDGFKFGRLDISYDLYVEQVRGFNGDINGSMGGKGSSYGPEDEARARSIISELPYYALKREMQLVGKANTPDWYLYQGLTLKRDFTNWASAEWVDARQRAADWIRPASPSP